MSSIRERLLGVSSDNSKSSIRDRLGLNSSYYKKEYENEISKRNEIQKNIQKSTYENGVQTTVTPFSTQRNILPVQEQTETTKNKKFQVTAGQDMLKKNKNIENKYQEIKQSDTYKKQIQELEDQSNKVGYAKYNYDKQRAAEDDIGWYDKSIGRLVDGFGNLIDYNGGLIKNENGNIQYLPTFNQMKNEKVQNEYDTMLGRIAGDVLYTSGKIAGSTLVNQVLPGVGSTMYYGKMFVDSTNQAISDGYDSSSATIYGLINVGFEYATGKLLGSATKGLTGGKASNYETLLNKAFSKIIKKPKIASILANAGSEATEEFVQEYLDNITKLAVLEKSTNIKDYSSIFTDEEILTDALYSAAVGGVTGGIFGTITGKDTNVDNDRLYKTYKEELEETKKNTTNTDTINKIDNIISNIDNQINTKSNTDTIISQINEYQALKKQNKLTKKQEVELKKLQEQLANIQNQNANAEVIDIINPTNVNNNTQESVPTVQDIVNMENRQKSNIDLPIFNNSNSNVELSLKEQQNSIIQNSNPVGDDYHTWIRSADDIKTFEETLNDSDYKEYFEAGEDFDETYTAEMARKALETGKITVYSSYPIEQGTFVSPSKMEAESYSGNGKVYSKEVNLTDVAWIDPTQGQYAKVSSKIAPVIDTTSVNNINTAIAPVDNNLSNKINQNNIKSDLNYSSNTSLSFSEQLDLWVQGKWNNRSQLVLFKHTPQLYLELGLKDNPITVSSSKLDRIINASGKQNGTYHNLGLETTKQLPNAIANPLNILESSTVDDSIVVVTELSDKEGRIVIVSMAIDGKGHIEVTDINNNKEIKRLNSNVMTSAYGRNNYEAWMESNRDRMIYDKDDGIIKKRINGEWLQLPKGINPFVDNNISQTNKNVKSSGTLSTINDMQNNENNTNNLAPVIDTTSVNNTNTVIVPVDVSQIKQSKGNIPINKELLNRYKSTNEMFNDYANNYNGEVSIKSDITELQNISVEKMKIGEVKKIAKEIFQKYNKSNIFYNDNNKILVNKTGIDESITKIFENRQQRE